MQSSGDKEFDLFWSKYPKRVKRILALREWLKLKGISVEVIVAGVERWKQSAQWQDLQYVPDPERFLKYRRWEDEVPVSAIRQELYAGQGPVCSPAAVRPEVLERIRMREAARGKR